jgi:hypothetical protein
MYRENEPQKTDHTPDPGKFDQSAQKKNEDAIDQVMVEKAAHLGDEPGQPE